MSTIAKTFIGKYIDLSKVIAISDADYSGGGGCGPLFVSFELDVQLRDDPISYSREFSYDETDENYKPIYVQVDGVGKPLAVVRLQKQIDELVEEWKRVTQ